MKRNRIKIKYINTYQNDMSSFENKDDEKCLFI